mgnify:CR=1 FL=1
MTSEDIQNTVNFIPNYEEIANILKCKNILEDESINQLFGNKDFFLTSLYIPPQIDGNTGHFATGIIKKNEQSRAELYVYDTDNKEQKKRGWFQTECGRIQYKHLNNSSLQGESNLCGIFTANAISLMATYQNFAQIEQLCNSRQFQQQNYDNVKSYLKGLVGLDLDHFVLNGVENGTQVTKGSGVGRVLVTQTVSKSIQPNISKTTDDIIKKRNQQTYVERLQQQRKRANSLPSKTFPSL